jgi:hypothetical protein
MARVFPKRVLPARRVTVIAAAVVVVAGAVAGGVAAAASGGPGSPAAGSRSAFATATVVRTDLVNTVQVGGSIGYGGSYTIAAQSGTSASTISQDQQAVTADRQALSAAGQAETDTSAADTQTITADQANVSTARSALSVDRAKEHKACAGTGASSQACNQDQQQVGQDQAALTQDRQQMAAARSTARTDHDQDQATVAADQTKLAGDQSTLRSDQATAVNPGTTFTWLPQPGQVIRRDQVVYSVSGKPVPLLYGPVPAWRAFYVGMSDGADVGELTRDLIALGYGDGLVRSDHYSAATAAALDRWQKTLGLPVTGRILLGEVVFEPGPIRVASVTASDGSPVGGAGSGPAGGGGGGTVLMATGTTPVVTIDLPVTQEYLVKAGNAVSVVLPDGTTTVPGKVESVGSVASCPGGGSTGTGGNGGGSTAGQSPCSSSGSGGGTNSSPTVTVTITLDKTPRGARLDQAPVNVNITSQRASNVLAVPVNALLALRGGGYGVDVVTPSGAVRLTGVTTGLYSATLVQVGGPGIAVGMRVEVPSS